MKPVGLLLLLSACSIPPLDVAGKPCTDSCGDGFTCTGRICVPVGGHFCDYFATATTCFDFDEGLKLDAGWGLEDVPGALRIDFDAGTLISEVADVDGGNGQRGRLRYMMPAGWKHVTESFDFKPTLVATNSFVAISEVQCVGVFQGAWFHYVNGSTSQFELRSGMSAQQVFLSPQPAMGAWSRITVDVSYESPPLAKIYVNDTLAASTPIDIGQCGDAGWQTNLGLSPQSGDDFERAEIDDFVYDLTP